jgi:hypothetical protein|tara:strand:- start:281 stop:550 length:270 start_codon:yes stop_codon:yes gene_type:complete
MIIETQQQKDSIIAVLENMIENYHDMRDELGDEGAYPNEEDCEIVLADIRAAGSFPVKLSLHTTAEDMYLTAWEQYNECREHWHEVITW